MQNCYPLYNPSNGTALIPTNGAGHYVIAFEGNVVGDPDESVTFEIRINNVQVVSGTFVTPVESNIRLFHFADLCPGNFVQVLVSGTGGTVTANANFHIARIY
jgi:hypothetical protein